MRVDSPTALALRHCEDIKNINPDLIGQAYISVDEMKRRWNDNFEENYNKVKNAVMSTEGIVMVHENQPIEAVFYSMSAGKTEDAKNVWGRELSYIKSVDSSVDEAAPNFIAYAEFSNQEFANRLSPNLSGASKENIVESFKISGISEAGYVTEVEVCGVKLTGRKIREIFNLRSTNFTVEKTGEKVIFTTKGYGHGAGMSQYGANFMAKDGYSYEEILSHYYIGISLNKAKK